VNVFDPKAIDNSRRLFPTLTYASSAREACEHADAVLVLTEWAEFVHMEPDELAPVVRKTNIVDGRRCLNAGQWIAAGWRYHALGGNTNTGVAELVSP